MESIKMETTYTDLVFVSTIICTTRYAPVLDRVDRNDKD